MASPIIRCLGLVLLGVVLLCTTCRASPDSVTLSDPVTLSYSEALNQVLRQTHFSSSHTARLLKDNSKQLLNLLSSADIRGLILSSASEAPDGKSAQVFAELKVGVEGWSVDTNMAGGDVARKNNGRGQRESGDGVGQSLLQCIDDFSLFQKAVESRELWAMKMLDAYGKPSPAIFDLNVLWLGAYDECREVTVTQNMTSDGHSFTGKYCNGGIPVILENSVLPVITVKEGLCVPSSCADFDVKLIFNVLLKKELNQSVSLGDVTCTEPTPKLDTLAITALAVCGAFVVLMVVGTALDVALVQVPRLRCEDTLSILMTGVDSRGEREPLLDVQKHSLSSQLGTCTKLLASFSVYSNVKKLVDTRQSAGSLTCIHGIRFLSMTWVVLGHSFWVATSLGSWNVGRWLEISMKRVMFQLVGNATVAVDTFFVLSGVLVSYLSLREMQKRKGRLNWFLFFFHRFWRLTPVYMMLVFLYLATMRHWGDGPLWPHTWPDRDNCRQSWWTNLLYVNNLVNTGDKMCFGHSWYLANDMQFYILSPFIFVPFYYSAAYGCLSALLFLLATTATPAVLTMLHHYPPGALAKVDTTQQNNGNWLQDFYIVPYTRMAPYVVGMVAGYIIYRCNATLRMPKVVAFLGWVVAGAMGLASLFGLYDATANDPMPVWQAALYNAAGRTAWGLFVAWVVLACATGNGGFVNTMLSWSAVVPLSRLTYCVYLVHLPLIYTVFLMRRTAFYVTDIDVVLFFLGMLLLSYMVALVTSLTLEAPMMGVEKVVLQRASSPSNKHSEHKQG